MMTIEDFRKLELKIGRVLEVQPHPNADKLYLIKVDLGRRVVTGADGNPAEERDVRELVAGIRAYYAAEALIGKQIVVLANLEPAVIRGITSQGMLLATRDSQNNLSIVTTERTVEEGSPVS